MNKQDKKEIMNLIKYKKMLGGRRMDLEKAIEVLKTLRDVAKQNVDYIETCKLEDFLDIKYKYDKEEFEAIDTVLNELEKQKQIKAEMRKVAFEEGYNQGYLEGAMRAFKEAEK